jgi:head-tail adaptor
MRAGKLRNKVYIQKYETLSDGYGGTSFVYFNNNDLIDTQFSERLGNDSVTTQNNVDCTADYVSEFVYEDYIWASIAQKQGGRGSEGSQIDLENYTEFRVRFEDAQNISKTWRLMFNSRLYTIHSYYVIEERRKEIVINAVEVK